MTADPTLLEGFLVSGFDIWEVAVIPMLLHNSETQQQDISGKTVDELEKILTLLIRSVFEVDTGCSIPYGIKNSAKEAYLLAPP